MCYERFAIQERDAFHLKVHPCECEPDVRDKIEVFISKVGKITIE